MKKIIILIAACVILPGCATTASTAGVQEPEPRFDDWQYKGFGQELPEWAAAAVDGDLQLLKRLSPETSDTSELIIIRTYGENPDQAMQKAAENSVALVPEEAELVDSIWLRFNLDSGADESVLLRETPYLAIRLYKTVF